MTIPSVLDPTLAPPGSHVVSLFTQYTPYHIEGREWTNQDREAYADTGSKHKISSSMLCLKLIHNFFIYDCRYIQERVHTNMRHPHFNVELPKWINSVWCWCWLLTLFNESLYVSVSPVFDWVEQYAPGFKKSVVGSDILAPPDLERIFGLTGGVHTDTL